VQDMEASSAYGWSLGCSIEVWFPGEENAFNVLFLCSCMIYSGCAVNDYTVMMNVFYIYYWNCMSKLMFYWWYIWSEEIVLK
jgi:hypothetical protein